MGEVKPEGRRTSPVSTAIPTTVNAPASKRHERFTRSIGGMLFILLWLWRIRQIVCFIPLVSQTDHCRDVSYSQGDHEIDIFDGEAYLRRADFTSLMEIQAKAFSKLLEAAPGYTQLRWDIEQAEMITTALIMAVQGSKLQSRTPLVGLLKEFVKDARDTGEGLETFNVKVGSALDQVMVISDHVLRTIQDAQGSLSTSNSIFSLLPWFSKSSDIDVQISQMFNEAMNKVSGELTRLVLEGQLSLYKPHALELGQIALHTLIKSDGTIRSADKNAILADLWTFLGSGRGQLEDIDERITPLKEIGSYMNQAKTQIHSALHTLAEMAQELEELRARVAAPISPPSRGPSSTQIQSMPLHMHIKNLQAGIEKLADYKERAKTMQETVLRKISGGVGAVVA